MDREESAWLRSVIMAAIVLMAVAGTADASYNWTAFTSTEFSTGLTISGKHVWCSTQGGVVCWDTADMTYVKYTTSDGLGANNVQAVTHGPDGTIYAGTRDGGLSSFDGASWSTVFDDYRFRNITSLQVSPDGLVWASANSGIHVGDTVENLHLCEQLGDYKKYHAECMTCAPDSSVLLGTGGGILRIRGDRFDLITPEYTNYQIVAIACTPNGDIWISQRRPGDFGWADSQIARFDGAAWTTFTKYSGIENLDVNVNAITVAPDGCLWFGCDTGIMRYDGAEFSKYLSEGDDVITAVKGIGIDDYGVVWACGTGKLARFNGVAATFYATANEPVGNNIKDIAIDANGVVWIGTFGKGVSRYDGVSWTTFTRKDGLGSDSIRAIDVSPVNNDIWMVDDIRISCFSQGSWKSDPIRCDGFNYPVTDVAVDHQGTVWVTANSGVYSFADSVWTGYTYVDGGINLSSANCVSVTDNDAVLIGTDRGLYRYFNGAWDVISPIRAMSIAVDSRGAIYTGGVSVVKYFGDTRATFALSEQVETPIIIDSHDVPWVVINYEGVGRLIGGRWIQEMPSPLRYLTYEKSLAIAPDGSLWMGLYGGGVFRITETAAHVAENGVRPESRLVVSNAPNPFNQATAITFDLPSADHVELTVYNALGQKVRTLISGKIPAGKHSTCWDGRDDTGGNVASGVYLTRLKTGTFSASNRMLLLK